MKRLIVIALLLLLLLITPLASAGARETYTWSPLSGGVGSTVTGVTGNMTAIYVGNTSAWSGVTALLVNHTSWISKVPPKTQGLHYGDHYSASFTLGNGTSGSGTISFWNDSTGTSNDNVYALLEFDSPVSLTGLPSQVLSLTYAENDLGGQLHPTVVGGSGTEGNNIAMMAAMGSPYYGSYSYKGLTWISKTPRPVPVCSYTASPSTGPGPLLVSFTDTTTNSPTSWDWVVKLNTTGTSEQHHTTFQDWDSTFYNVGTYDVNLSAANSYGSCTLYVPNAITVSSSANISIQVHTLDGNAGGSLYGAEVGIFDYDGLVWSQNQTASSGYATFSYTGASNEHPLTVGKHVLIGASATGYRPGYVNLTIPYNGYILPLPLYRTDILPSSGNATVVVNVVKNIDGSALQGASVFVENADLMLGIIKSTNAAGTISFVDLPSDGPYSLEVSKSGYQTASMMIEPPADEVTTIDISLVAIGATPTPTTTGTVTGATTTSASAAWAALSAEEQVEGIWDLIRDNAWNLVYLAIIVVMMTMLGWLIKSF